ncbi:MAG: hypothetical protein ACYC05_03515 [Sulfuricella sp.]|nr:hypothetical protein [Gammaproteobacteria bacterium]
MTELIGGGSPIEVYEKKAGLVCVNQKSASGEEQTILIELEQMEKLTNWLLQYAQTVRETQVEE